VDDAAQQRTTIYAYDAGGNMTSATAYAYTLSPSPGPPLEVTYCSYGNPSWRDQLTGVSVHPYVGGQPGPAASSFSPAYDQVGNPLSWRGGMSMSWGFGRRLMSVAGPGLAASYSYDASGVRASKTVNGVTTAYHTSGGAVLRQSGGGVTLDFAHDEAGRAIGFTKGGAWYWYVFDLQGDVIGILDGSGALVASYSYDAWGRTADVSGPMAGTVGLQNPYRYRGYYYDSETGLYYLLTRYYDPEVGRFVNADGLASTGHGVLGHNMYAYCLNDPVNHSDPTGMALTDIYHNEVPRYQLNKVRAIRNGTYLEPKGTYGDGLGYVYVAKPAQVDAVKGYSGPNDVVVRDWSEVHDDPNMQIIDSYRIAKRDHQREILQVLLDYCGENPEYPPWYRTMDTMLLEWDVHNALYSVFDKDAFRSADLNNNDEVLYQAVELYIWSASHPEYYVYLY
jgi:RHS repeat-associated protein